MKNNSRVTELKVCCVVKKDDEILLIKEWSEAKKDYFWNVIKGTFEGDIDKNLFDCAIREMDEEAHVNALPTDFLGVVNKNGFSTRVYFGFLCTVNNDTDKPKGVKKMIKGEDIKEIKLFSLIDLKSMKVEQFINDVAYYFIQKTLNGETFPLNSLLKEEYLGSN